VLIQKCYPDGIPDKAKYIFLREKRLNIIIFLSKKKGVILMAKYDFSNQDTLFNIKLDFIGDGEKMRDIMDGVEYVANYSDMRDAYSVREINEDGTYKDIHTVEGTKEDGRERSSVDVIITSNSDGEPISERVESRYIVGKEGYERSNDYAYVQINYKADGGIESKQMHFEYNNTRGEHYTARDIEVKFENEGKVEVISSFEERREGRGYSQDVEKITNYKFYENGELVRVERVGEYEYPDWEGPDRNYETRTTETYVDNQITERVSVATEFIDGGINAQRDKTTIDRYEDGKIISSEEIRETKIIASDGEPIASFTDIGEISRVEKHYDTKGRMVEKIEYRQTRDGEVESKIVTFEFNEDGECNCSVSELDKETGEIVETEKIEHVESFHEPEEAKDSENFELFKYDLDKDISPDNEDGDEDAEKNPDNEIFDVEDYDDGENDGIY